MDGRRFTQMKRREIWNSEANRFEIALGVKSSQQSTTDGASEIDLNNLR